MKEVEHEKRSKMRIWDPLSALNYSLMTTFGGKHILSVERPHFQTCDVFQIHFNRLQPLTSCDICNTHLFQSAPDPPS